MGAGHVLSQASKELQALSPPEVVLAQTLCFLPDLRRNILPNISTSYLKSCIYDAQTDPFCPIFRLGKIVEDAGHSFQDMAVEVGASTASRIFLAPAWAWVLKA